jgi:hypothetical protein
VRKAFTASRLCRFTATPSALLGLNRGAAFYTMSSCSPTVKLVELPLSSSSSSVPVLAAMLVIVVVAPLVTPWIVNGTVGSTANAPFTCIETGEMILATVTGSPLSSVQLPVAGGAGVSPSAVFSAIPVSAWLVILASLGIVYLLVAEVV